MKRIWTCTVESIQYTISWRSSSKLSGKRMHVSTVSCHEDTLQATTSLAARQAEIIRFLKQNLEKRKVVLLLVWFNGMSGIYNILKNGTIENIPKTSITYNHPLLFLLYFIESLFYAELPGRAILAAPRRMASHCRPSTWCTSQDQ